MFIVIEGIDGCGKTTLVNRLKKELPNVVFLAEPTNVGYGKIIREESVSRVYRDYYREVGLFLADRLHDVTCNILPSLLEGKTVIMDRYIWSSIAYQGTGGIVSADPGHITYWNKYFPIPDLIIYLRISAEVAAERRKKRGGVVDAFEKSHFGDLIAVYDSLAAINSDICRTIDGEQSEEEILKEVLGMVGECLAAHVEFRSQYPYSDVVDDTVLGGGLSRRIISG